VRYGLTLQSMSALSIVACDADFFAREALDVELVEYVSGKRALAALLAGEVDAITTAEVPIVLASMGRDGFRIVAGLGSLSTNIERIVARKDAGIETPADLRRKRIATQRGSAVHFFLHMFLAKNGLSVRDVDISFMKAEELPGALVRGEIDAFSMREPYVGQAVAALANQAVVFEEPGVYYRSDYLVVSEALAQSKPDVVHRMVRALVDAEALAAQDPVRVVNVVTKRLHAMDKDIVRKELAHTTLTVNLDQSLLTVLEDTARWAIDAGLTDQANVPNYLNYLYLDALEAAKPDAVTIIR